MKIEMEVMAAICKHGTNTGEGTVCSAAMGCPCPRPRSLTWFTADLYCSYDPSEG